MTREHTDREYEGELRTLREQLLLMGARVEEMLASSMKALVERDSDLARRMIAYDSEIDRLEVAIDNQCIRILARRQPVASDLRFLAVTLKIVTSLERIGDLGVNICERAIELNAEPPLKPFLDLPRMAEAVEGMIRQALDAFVAEDADLARSVTERDHLIDAYYGQTFRELLTYMMEDSGNIHRAIKAQAVAKYLERIGDHAASLAEMVVFLARGKDVRHQGLVQARKARPHGVLFLSSRDAARGPMAEAWARVLFPAGVRIWSAGKDPDDRIDPRAVRAMQEVGIDISVARPRRLDEVSLGDVDTVIALCPEEQCPVVEGDLHRESWILPDAAAAPGDEEAVIEGFRAARDTLRLHIDDYMHRWRG